jgi:hypothetical protein
VWTIRQTGTRNEVKKRLIEPYRNGQKSKVV